MGVAVLIAGEEDMFGVFSWSCVKDENLLKSKVTVVKGENISRDFRSCEGICTLIVCSDKNGECRRE